jgi:hypothetical protein
MVVLWLLCFPNLPTVVDQHPPLLFTELTLLLRKEKLAIFSPNFTDSIKVRKDEPDEVLYGSPTIMPMALTLVMITAIRTIATEMLFLIPPDFHLLLEKRLLPSKTATIALLPRQT